MKIALFKNAKFIKTAVAAQDYPTLRSPSGDLMPEIAVVGRSNVGKSSLLNHLFQHKGMARTSQTPGKTQAINFFTLSDQLAFVDLPGYGYAKLPPEVRKQWTPMIETYLTTRPALKVILFLLDIRHLPSEDDRLLIDWLSRYGKTIIFVLTKADKLNQSTLESSMQKILKSINASEQPCAYYSTTKNIGRQELIHLIINALNTM